MKINKLNQCGALLITACTATAASAVDVELVYLGGHTVVPGEEETFAGASVSEASINAQGQVLARRSWSFGENSSGVGSFRWENGVLADVLKSTDAVNAPGFGGPAVFVGRGLISDSGNAVLEYRVGSGIGSIEAVASGPNRAGLDKILQDNFNIAPGTDTGFNFFSPQAYSGRHVAYFGAERRAIPDTSSGLCIPRSIGGDSLLFR